MIEIPLKRKREVSLQGQQAVVNANESNKEIFS
jgi:hypothetical protein